MRPAVINDQRRRKTDLRHAEYVFSGRGRMIVAFADYNLAYTPDEIDQFIELWKAGNHIADIYDALQRHEVEVEILALYLGHRGKIKPRPGGVWGCSR